MSLISGLPRISLSASAAAVPYLQTKAVVALKKVAATVKLTVNSGTQRNAVFLPASNPHAAIRSIPQQLFIVLKHARGACGFLTPAKPGSPPPLRFVSLVHNGSILQPDRSPHLSGAAVDLAEAASVKSQMKAQEFAWQGSADPVHYTKTDCQDLRSANILAFQKLYNKCNNDGKKIAADGAYGPQTQNAILSSPVDGWPGCSVCPS